MSVSGRDPEALEECRRLTGSHVQVCDIAQDGEPEKQVAAAADALGGIDILVNNASAFSRGNDVESWETAFSVDLMGAVRTNSAAVPLIAGAGSGAIINIASISAFHATPAAAPYGALKAALVHFTASQALQLAEKGIRVNAVAPGAVTFPGHFWEERRINAPERYQAIVDSIPFGRLGTPEEIADVVLFLASPLARWITGQTIVVDGGQDLA